MGCSSSSVNNSVVIPHQMRKLVVVDTGVPGSKQDSERLFPNILVYSLSRFHLECTISLPNLENDSTKQLSRGYSLACHPTKPHFFISGGLYADDNNRASLSPHVWRIDVTPEDDYLMTSLTDLPLSCEGLKTCVCCGCEGDHEYLYAFTDEYALRLNLEITAHWENLQPLPITISEVSHVIACGDLIAFLASDHNLYCFDRPSDVSDSWNERSPKLLSSPALVADSGSGSVYVIGHDTEFVTKLDVHNNERHRLAHENIDMVVLRKSCGFAATGGVLVASGPHYDDDILSVIEVDLESQVTVALGCLESVSWQHNIFALRTG